MFKFYADNFGLRYWSELLQMKSHIHAHSAAYLAKQQDRTIWLQK